MVKRTDFTPPYVRISPNTDPTKALKFLYDNPALGTSRHYGSQRKPAKSLGGGKDASRSPFSAAGRNFGGK